MTNIMLTIALSIIAGFTFAMEWKLRTFTLLIWPFIAIYTIIPLLLASMHIIDIVDAHILSNAVLIAICITTPYSITFFLLNYQNLRTPRTNKLNISNIYKPIPYICIAVVFIILAINNIGFNTIFISTWRDQTQLGFGAVIILWSLSLLSGPMAAALKHKEYLLFLSALITFIIILIFFRTRAILIIALFPLLMILIESRRNHFLSIVTFAFALFLSASMVRAIRFQGRLDNVVSNGNLTQTFAKIISDTFETGDLSSYKYFLYIVRDCGAHINCFNATTSMRVFEILGLTRLDQARLEYYLFDQYNIQGIGGSIHPTFYGIAYGDFGLIGGMIFAASLAALHTAFRALRSPRYAPYVIGFFGPYCLFFARGSFYNSFSALVVGIVIALSISLITKRRH
ncbi:O-antigen polymerase [Glycocaulis albus]|uniref:O-antigen polymerase n=1 Tax=Glycocaulis albus TaxID=1382801 RepID=UPI001665C189|nr:O-antigen polymerase [Glycocaulis albus]